MAITTQIPIPVPGTRLGTGGDYPPGTKLPTLNPPKGGKSRSTQGI